MRTLLCSMFLSVLAVSCTKTDVRDAVDTALEGETMGSTWHTKIQTDSARVPAAQAMQTVIDDALERINDEMSTYRPNSEISRFNAHASAEPFAVSEETAFVVRKALDVGAQTEGAYDITIDPLIVLWGFDRKGHRDSPPDQQAGIAPNLLPTEPAVG